MPYPQPEPLPDSFPDDTMFFSSMDDRHFCLAGKRIFVLTPAGLLHPVSLDALPFEKFSLDEAGFRKVAARRSAAAAATRRSPKEQPEGSEANKEPDSKQEPPRGHNPERQKAVMDTFIKRVQKAYAEGRLQSH